MAKKATAGALRTRIRVVGAGDDMRDADGYLPDTEAETLRTRCKWVNAYGREVYDAKQAGVEEPATLTLRYTPKISTICKVYRDNDPTPYEVISLNDVENRHIWLEVKVSRKARTI